ncbi:pirin family protein [Acuticoccus sp. M5D2P5]|uniref:pirin family protein n=1 Tax=Acuticoccus kalidii TaxID=2910977 RepID=UPI001F3EF3BF|nr:pirin-like C-terminal cupin domain-containing protein [Acuticoccus kalidii]MCF3933823.1 pirin family protein [Acuticoccus kalidii]
MADDQITAPGAFGEAHPHAGLETVTFMLSGTMADKGGRLAEGDVEWMTAGSGIVHSEDATVSAGLRLLQLWLVLPERQRTMEPRVQILRREAMPVLRREGVTATVYSGRLEDAAAPTLNAVPVTLADIRLAPGARYELALPASHNGVLVVVDGTLAAGEAATSLTVGAVGWTSPHPGDGASALMLAAGREGARVLLYSGEPQRIEVAARGPFIAGSKEELDRLFAAYRRGGFPKAGNLRPAAPA